MITLVTSDASRKLKITLHTTDKIQWLQPFKNVIEIKFLGLCIKYCRLVLNFARMASTLNPEPEMHEPKHVDRLMEE